MGYNEIRVVNSFLIQFYPLRILQILVLAPVGDIFDIVLVKGQPVTFKHASKSLSLDLCCNCDHLQVAQKGV